MKKNLIKKIKCLLCGVLLLVPLFPYNIYADTITQSDIQGVERVLVNSTYLDQTVTNSGNTYKYYSFDYEVTVLLKDYYLGWIQGIFQTSFKTFDNANWQVQNSSCTTVSKSYYVNDNKFKSSFTITAWVLVNQQGNVDPSGSYTTSFTLLNSNVVAYQDLNSIDTVIDLLQDVNQYVSIDILDELQNIVTNTDLSNTYLDTISKLRQYNVSFASYSWLTRIFNQNIQVKANNKIYYFNYPVYDIPSNFYLLNVNLGTDSNQKLWVFFMSSTYISESNISNIFNLSSFNVEYFTFNNNFKPYFIYKICLSGNYSVNQNANYNLITRKALNDFIPLSYGVYNSNNSDDIIFAFDNELATLLEVNNKELYYLNIIAQGTSASNSSSNDLEDSADDIIQNSSTMFNFENQQNQNMNNALQNINTNYDIGSFGSSFLASANWVRTQFDNITSSTPFGSILSFSLLLGLALLIIGKVYK